MKQFFKRHDFSKPAVVFLSIILLLGVSAIYGEGEKNVKRLLFHAGAGQRSSLDEIAKIYQERHPDVKVDFSYKGSGYFLADLTLSHEGDLYMPGEEYYLKQAVEKGFIKSYNPDKDIPAYFITVIITPKGNPKSIKSVLDFAKPGLRIGLGDPEACAIGLWHEKIFKEAGIWDAVKKNATMSAKCIAELGNASQLNAIDGTIVWATTAILYLKDVEIIPIDPKYRGLVRLPVGILEFSKYPEDANKLKEFIMSDEGKNIFHSHAYCINPEKVEEDLKWIQEAAKVAKDPSAVISEKTVGPLVKEVTRQRASRK
jgi:molybdate transport system substrate-binding protein